MWARRHGEGRVLYTVLGHDEDAWRSKPFQTIVTGGLEWVLGRVDAKIPPNLADTAPEAHKLP
jgi:type 1 glutamine amidotransferase